MTRIELDIIFFLRQKGLLNQESSEFIINGDFGKVTLNELILDYIERRRASQILKETSGVLHEREVLLNNMESTQERIDDIEKHMPSPMLDKIQKVIDCIEGKVTGKDSPLDQLKSIAENYQASDNVEDKMIINKSDLEIIKGLIIGYSANQKHSTLVETLSYVNRLIDEH